MIWCTKDVCTKQMRSPELELGQIAYSRAVHCISNSRPSKPIVVDRLSVGGPR